MPYGFSGNSSEKYYQSVDKALRSAIGQHETNRYSSPNSPSNSARSYLSERSSKATGGGFCGVGNKTNVVVDFDICQDFTNKIQLIEKETAQKLLNVALQIRELLDTFYIMPSTSPRVAKINNKSEEICKRTFSRTPDIETNARNHSDTIVYKTV